MDFLKADLLPWLAAAQGRVRQSAAAGRLPHSLLILSVPGLGAEYLAQWTAAFALCESGARPCGECPSCALLRADTHPDITRVLIEEDAQQIKVDQVRALIDGLTMKSYRGGYKVGVIEGAEALNANGANAFLKTLEEPTQNTMLIMTAAPTHRLPATIASRCLRLTLKAPPAEEANAWLAQHGGSSQSWGPALALAGGAPLLAVQIDPDRITAFEREMRETIGQLSAGAVDISLVAEKWARSDTMLRLAWLENWITARVHAGLVGPRESQTAEPVRLPAALLKPKIRGLFELLDAARRFKRLASTGMNQQLALESLLLEGRAALITR